jgi:hypothetical protein
MKLLIRLAGLVGLAGTLGFAATWSSGPLVDARCYTSLRNNTRSSLIYIDRDFAGMIRYCSPTAKTKSFAVVEQGGIPVALDPQGNAQAAQFVRKTGKKRIVLAQVVRQTPRGKAKVTKLWATKYS